MIRVEGQKNLYRDEKTGAVVNCDDSEYNQYILSKKEKMIQKKEIESIKMELDEIKSLLKEILNGTKWHWTFEY